MSESGGSGGSGGYTLGSTILGGNEGSAPFASVVTREFRSRVCDFCYKVSLKVLNHCSGCSLVYYCNRTCQGGAWKKRGHKLECPILRGIKPKVPPDTVRLIIRIIHKLAYLGGTTETATLPDGTKRRFDDLMSHSTQIPKDEPRIKAFKSYLEVIKDCLKNDPSLPNSSEILEIYGRVLINSFHIMNNEYQSIGIGLYLNASVLDHSCNPNASVSFIGNKIMVKSVSALRIESFTDVRICYINLLNTSVKRKMELKSQYYFTCTCQNCHMEKFDDIRKGSMKCPDCLDAIAVSIPEEKEEGAASSSEEDEPPYCFTCTKPMAKEAVDQFKDLRQEVIETLFQNKNNHPDPDDLYEDYARDVGSRIHPYDRLAVDYYESLFEQRMGREDWNGALEVSALLLIPYRLYYPKYDINTALMALKAGKLALYLDRLIEAEKYIAEAEDILRVTHGDNHQFITRITKELKNDIKMAKLESTALQKESPKFIKSLKQVKGVKSDVMAKSG